MKLTKKQLKQIIEEELINLKEAEDLPIGYNKGPEDEKRWVQSFSDPKGGHPKDPPKDQPKQHSDSKLDEFIASDSAAQLKVKRGIAEQVKEISSALLTVIDREGSAGDVERAKKALDALWGLIPLDLSLDAMQYPGPDPEEVARHHAAITKSAGLGKR